MLEGMNPIWARALAASALIVMPACGGQAFRVVTSDAGELDATAGDASDATDAAREGASEAAGDSGADVTDATSYGAPEASPGSDAQWVPDVIEEPPPHCASGFACAAAVPSGWSGPMEVYAGAAPPSACGANFEGPVYAGGDTPAADDAMCDCRCQAAQNVQCSAIDIAFYGGIVGSACSATSSCTQKTLTPGVCTRVNAAADCDAGTASIRMPVPLATGGSCTPLPTRTLTPPSWTVSARACISALGPASSDCPSGQTCSPLPAAPFGSLCIAQTGILSCPTSGYTARRIYYEGFADTRDCSTCSCGDVSGASCAASLDVFPVPVSPTTVQCAAGAITYAAPVTCDPVQQPGDFRLTTSLASVGSCSPSPVTATGSVNPADPTTFCCLP
jgi:hypothetical protein